MHSPDPPARVTLPSINELFPEHLMAHPSAIDRHSPPRSPVERLRGAPEDGPPRTQYPAAGPSSASCSFDVLRPHPLTANLENVASSTNSPVPPRVPAPGAYAFAVPSSSDAYVASITKARPTFRVQLAPHPHEYAPPTQYDRHDPQQSASAPVFTPSFSANTYLSSPTTAGSAQSLQRLAQQQLPPAVAQAADEKRHRCPHCNKRFNRPSSLNIHVNTHTGAKPFVCRFPGCNRKFNVNSNMRRHYRNHLAARRRDVVARHMRPLSPSPSFSHSSPSERSPEESYRHAFPPPTPSYGSQSHSPSPSAQSEYSESESESDDRAVSYARGFKMESSPADGRGAHTDRARLRARSSPVPRSVRHYPYPPAHAARPRASSSVSVCTVPGCRCSTISTALRPAFPESAPAQRAVAERT